MGILQELLRPLLRSAALPTANIGEGEEEEAIFTLLHSSWMFSEPQFSYRFGRASSSSAAMPRHVSKSLRCNLKCCHHAVVQFAIVSMSVGAFRSISMGFETPYSLKRLVFDAWASEI